MNDSADQVARLEAENRALKELLDGHQEIDRLQGNRIDELERALGQTHAELRGAQREIQHLNSLLNGYAPKPRP